MSKKCIPCGTPPTPYYKGDKNSVTQDHASVYRDTAYAAGIRFPEEFVVPAIGEDVQVCSKELVNVVVGSYVWNPAYGYLKIANWDSCTGKIGLLNDDIQGAAIPGTVASAGSLWAVTARPCCADQETFSIFPFLAENYVIPGVGNSVTLSVTSTYGLIAGTNVRIGSNVYYLDTINSSLEIVVTNEGAGGTPGDIVDALDINGDYQYLITQAVTSACTSPSADVVKLIGCDGANEAILEGEFPSQVPVLQDPLSSEVAFYLLDTEVRNCTSLTAPVNVLTLTPSYTIEVDDESIFTIGDIIQLGTGALRWEITDNTVPGELDITCTQGFPGSTFTIVAGSSVCTQFTTDTLQEEITELETELVAVDVQLQSQLSFGWVPLATAAAFVSVSSFAVAGDVTSFLKIGLKLKLSVNGSPFYGNVLSSAFALGVTTVNILVNLDYVLAALDVITTVEFSLVNPQDFPPYFNYDINPQGFSGGVTYTASYWIIDSEFRMSGYAYGNSDDTSIVISVPVDPVPGYGLQVGQTFQNGDAGVGITTIGMVLSFGGGIVYLYKDQSLGGWTPTGVKQAAFSMAYIMIQ